MKYLLGIGASLREKYRQFPSIRVCLDDQFLDEYNVEDLRARKDHWYSDPSHWVYDDSKSWMYHSGYNYWKEHKNPRRLFSPDCGDGYFPNKFRCYVVDGDQLKQNKHLYLRVSNDDNNYTNGFISKSTLMDLSKIFLVPLEYFNFFLKDRSDALRHKFNTEVIPAVYDADEQSEKNLLVLNGLKSTSSYSPENPYNFHYEGYPFAMRFFWNDEEMYPSKIGGSGTLRIDLTKNKHDIVMLDQSNSHMFEKYKHGIIDGFPIAERFFNIAEKFDEVNIYNEDQRSDST